MARLNTAFDATGIEPVTAHEILPAGKYLAQIVESEMRVTRNGMGQYLWLMLEILEGPHKGRRVFDQLNLVNPNPITVEIAQRTLSAICHATGRLQVSDSEELHLIPMTIQVGVKPPKDGYGERNTIRYLVPETPAQATAPRPSATPPASAPAQPAPARPATAPWNRRS
ncbi:DUF669 domain-containing protein [Paracoccus bogoriensis]|uniref:DUF669 domain-containing protein n=1 Tax=Paracoccus bogoriensis TaxID=242065 RepID=UPI001C6675FC|nr:DUF669 domain-containing protein [Paracoccus bogoriensis]MBW7057639.1 DUF669 domain-containing protein [Paracoccus bogoriensis]